MEVLVESVVSSPQSKDYHLFLSGQLVVAVWLIWHFEDGLNDSFHFCIDDTVFFLFFLRALLCQLVCYLDVQNDFKE